MSNNRMVISLRKFAVAAAIPGVLVLAPTAAADDQSFIIRFVGEGIGNGRMTNSTAVKMGHIMCDKIRAGQPVAEVAAIPRGRDVDGGRMTQVAREEICPDTLG